MFRKYMAINHILFDNKQDLVLLKLQGSIIYYWAQWRILKGKKNEDSGGKT